ncbi:hypothetical protein PAPHI01_1260 [Pancytospora philotis]|nr:hypothetical protein PAPHI01_1260 [Pancytospora philotis]
MHTLFISNIDYQVSRRCLHDLLVQIGAFATLEYTTKVAFVEYESEACMRTAWEVLSGVELYGRKVVVQIVEPRCTLAVECAAWCDTAYISDIFRKFGSCSCHLHANSALYNGPTLTNALAQRKEQSRRVFLCTFRKRVDADKALSALHGKSLLGNVFHITKVEPVEP